jgi:hypothetical protein
VNYYDSYLGEKRRLPIMGLPTILPTPDWPSLGNRALPNLAMLGLERWYHAFRGKLTFWWL